MLFSGLACFSPTVPSYIRTLWVKHGGILTHNDDDFRKANFFFCEGMEDPWVNELLSRSLIVRHAAWVVLCVVEEFLMPIADYTLDDGFDESKIRILESKSLATAPGAVTSDIAQLQENSAPPAPSRKPARGLASPYQTQPTNQRKRKHDEDQSGDEDKIKQEAEVQDLQRPRKKAKWDLDLDRENALEESTSTMPPVRPLEGVSVAPPGLALAAAGAGAVTAAAVAIASTTRRRRRRELPFAFSTVRAAQTMIMKPTSIQVHALKPDANAKVSSGVSAREQREGKQLTRLSKSTIAAGGGGGEGGGSKARRAFEKCIVRSTENRGAVAPSAGRPLLPVDMNVNVNGPPPSAAAASVPLNSSGKRGERASAHTKNPTLNAHTLFWNDLLARSFLKLNNSNGPYPQQHQNRNQNQLLELSVGDLQHAPRTKAVIFDVDKTYRGRRFINLDNEK